MLYYCSILFISLFFSHPLHVSITSVEINNTQGEISVSHKFFTDDFSLLFFHLYEENIVPKDEADFTESELDIINRYISDAFRIKPDNDSSIIDFRYTGKRQNDDSVWLYYKGNIPEGGCNSFMLTDRIMIDLYFNQTNLVIVVSEAQEKGFTFDYDVRQAQVEFND